MDKIEIAGWIFCILNFASMAINIYVGIIYPTVAPMNFMIAMVNIAVGSALVFQLVRSWKLNKLYRSLK